jgi:hypothetical protein
MKRVLLAVLIASACYAFPVLAQEPVTAASNAQELFASPDPKLHGNKQVAYHILREVEDSKHPKGRYTTTWFDMWRIVDGKAVEHWDPALLGEAPDLRPGE